MTPVEHRGTLARFCRARNAAGFGTALLADIRTDDFLVPPGTVARYPSAVSVALPVAEEVLATLDNRPNRLYEHHYRQVNFALDRLALDLAAEIRRLGYRALPFPASQLVDWEHQRGHLSHKRVAVAAGLGWLGRNNLLVTPALGARVRLVTLLTDLPLPAGGPLDRDCVDCHRCQAACPAGAVGDAPADFDHHACFAKLQEFQRDRYVSQYICGLCVRACAGPDQRV